MAGVRANARRIAQEALKRVAATADGLFPPARGVVVLIYHRVGRRTTGEVDLPLDRFEAQIAKIAASGRATTLDAALAALQSGPPAAGNPVVVTFDDGTADFADLAVPILARHGVPALCYLATAFIGGSEPFPGGALALSWDAVRDLDAAGLVSFGSHTHAHALLDRLAPADAANDLDRSIDAIGTALGRAPRHFAYPKAVAPSAAVEDLVRARFASAALAGTRANRYGETDPYRLSRSPIQYADADRWFDRKVAGGLHLEDDVRRLANRFRYAGATT
jgi:peptidoglycan/xylan/chitin deacetylase (PgdA/CDA1 family)